MTSEKKPGLGAAGSNPPHQGSGLAGGLFALGEELHTSRRVKELAGKGLHNPSQLSLSEIEELCGSVLRHIERHGG